LESVNVHRQALRRDCLESFAAPSAGRARVHGIGRRTTASKRRSDVTDPIADIIGDYRSFAALQRDRLLARGIDIAPYELSHLRFRAPEWDQYVHARTLLERHAVANRETGSNLRTGKVPARPSAASFPHESSRKRATAK
jgi:hypothetical protein